MYGAHAAGSGASLGAGTLAMTGFNTFWMVLTATALVTFGILLTRLAPRREF